MGKRVWIVVLVLLLVAAAAAMLLVKGSNDNIHVSAYFQNVSGLQRGAPVRLAGVDVGKVTDIRVHLERHENPVEVAMALRKPESGFIPRDSIVLVSPEGVLGPAFVDVDVRNTSGAPVQDGTVLQALAVETLTPKQILDRLSEIAKQKQAEESKH
ncbi:MAG: MlaD family protein [Candidatus Korobacteraceae bacterium]